MKIDIGRAGDPTPFSDQDEFVSFFCRSNEDVTDPDGLLVVLADDVSGLEAEREAACLALRAMGAAYLAKNRNETIPRALQRALDAANDIVVAFAQDHHAGAVGVSLVAAVVARGALYWTSVGDSRLYCQRNGELIQLNSEQTFAKHLRSARLKNEEPAENLGGHQDPDALTSYLGMDQILELDANIRPFLLDPGDRLLVCSNKVYRTVGENRIGQLLTAEAQSAAETLANEARAGATGKESDVSVAVVTVADRKAHAAPAVSDLPFMNVTKNRKTKAMLVTLSSTVAAAFLTLAVVLFLNESQETDLEELSPTTVIPKQPLEQIPPDGTRNQAVEGCDPSPDRSSWDRLQYRDLNPCR